MKLPKRFEILRRVDNSSRSQTPLAERPKQVWTLLNEAMFNEIGLKHWYSAFIEDPIHDWDWRDGVLYFYGHSGEPGDKHDLVVVYEE